jgi:hypothetical protein
MQEFMLDKDRFCVNLEGEYFQYRLMLFIDAFLLPDVYGGSG